MRELTTIDVLTIIGGLVVTGLLLGWLIWLVWSVLKAWFIRRALPVLQSLLKSMVWALVLGGLIWLVLPVLQALLLSWLAELMQPILPVLNLESAPPYWVCVLVAWVLLIPFRRY